jgi:hypothetical protein
MKHQKKLRAISFLLAVTFLFTSCASKTVIDSTPSSARIYIDGQRVGTTPYIHRDSKISGSFTAVKLELEGFETLNTDITKNEQINVGAIIGGCFVLVPFFWGMKYYPTHNYELVSKQIISDTKSNNPSTPISTKSKIDRLREIKQMLDEKILNQEEYEKEKKKILEEE